ncbi:hypothetical protein Vadar_007556 [Vaccinium darrowii]|uniref:Uncharacterized protein n=1 Tax=Vaccinium darrowii TaxID=229202 RepID=A0ACB7XZ29_9ERIC|nr:hypothetical protein Vadar_007556 [Vaccinium darrowii]
MPSAVACCPFLYHIPLLSPILPISLPLSPFRSFSSLNIFVTSGFLLVPDLVFLGVPSFRGWYFISWCYCCLKTSSRGRKQPLVFNNKELITLFVDNILEEANTAWLLKTFVNYGIVKETYLPAKKNNRGSRFGFVRYNCPISAKVAITKASGMQVGDNKLFVKTASFNSKFKRDNGNHLRSPNGIAESSYKGIPSWKKTESNHLAFENSYAHTTIDKGRSYAQAPFKGSTAKDFVSHNAMMEEFFNLHGECKEHVKGKHGTPFAKATNSNVLVNSKEGTMMDNNWEGSSDSLVPKSVVHLGLDLVPFNRPAQLDVGFDLSESQSNNGESNGICSQINLRPS